VARPPFADETVLIDSKHHFLIERGDSLEYDQDISDEYVLLLLCVSLFHRTRGGEREGGGISASRRRGDNSTYQTHAHP